MVEFLLLPLLQLCSSDSPSIRGILMSVTPSMSTMRCCSSDASASTRHGRTQSHRAVPDLLTKFLQDESLQDQARHRRRESGAVMRPFEPRIDLSRSIAKSIGLVKEPSAPLSSALRLVSASP